MSARSLAPAAAALAPAYVPAAASMSGLALVPALALVLAPAAAADDVAHINPWPAAFHYRHRRHRCRQPRPSIECHYDYVPAKLLLLFSLMKTGWVAGGWVGGSLLEIQ